MYLFEQGNSFVILAIFVNFHTLKCFPCKKPETIRGFVNTVIHMHMAMLIISGTGTLGIYAFAESQRHSNCSCKLYKYH